MKIRFKLSVCITHTFIRKNGTGTYFGGILYCKRWKLVSKHTTNYKKKKDHRELINQACIAYKTCCSNFTAVYIGESG